ncbi:MAG: hypothetical protein WC841_04060 [Candidatus Shapirobacteria bacterium]
MFKRLFGLLTLFFLLNSSPAFAGSPGINLINDPASANWVADPAVKNWMTIIPETPEGLARFENISASNVVIRIHANWTNIGKKMLSDDASQTQAANDWCRVINSYAPGKTVYIEPFNELEQDYERETLSGIISLDAAIERAHSFITKLQSCLTRGPIISPALDPQNANFPKTSAAFGPSFSIISYHPYREDTAKNYSSGPLAGKQFIFTEVGVDNGGVIYDDCEFIKFFCGKGITAFWQGQGDILAYTLFTFSPGNYAGSWRLTNPKVTDALKANCPDDIIENCAIDPDATIYNPNTSWGYPPPIDLKEAVRGVPNEADPRHPEDKASKFYSNSNEINFSTCTYKVSASETINPKVASVGVSGAGNTYQRQEVNDIEQIKNERKTNPSPRNSSIHLAKQQPPDFNATPEQLNDRFLNYGNQGDNATVRYMTEDDKLYLKGIFIEDACRSLDGLHDVISTDEQLAWSCPDGPKNLFPKPSDASCRPVTVCEVGWNYYKRGINTSYEKPVNYTLKKIPLPGDVVAIMLHQFEGGGYQSIFGKSFSPLSDSAYDTLYRQMPIVPRGSINTQVLIKDDETGEETKKDRTIPLGSVLSSLQVSYALGIFNPQEDHASFQTEPSEWVCTKYRPGDPSVDKPTPLTLWIKILQFFGVVENEAKTFSGEKEVTLILPASLVDNLKTDTGYLKLGLPAEDQEKYELDKSPNSSTGKEEITRDFGQKDVAARNLFDLYMKPEDWKKVNTDQPL